MIEELLEPLVPQRFRDDERYREGHVRIINALPGRRIIGVHIPDMVSLSKTLVRRQDALDIIARFEAAASEEAQTGRRDLLSHEEMMVWGMMINGLGRSSAALQLELLKQYVPYIDNWAVCDHVAGAAKWFGRAVKQSLKVSLADGAGPLEGNDGRMCESLWKFLCGYFASDREFEVRFATVMAMCHFLDERYLPRIFFRFDSLDFSRIRSEYVCSSDAKISGRVAGEPPYYVRMGVAWLLATALAKFPEQTREYVRTCNLPDDVVRLYVRKAKESFRTRDTDPL